VAPQEGVLQAWGFVAQGAQRGVARREAERDERVALGGHRVRHAKQTAGAHEVHGPPVEQPRIPVAVRPRWPDRSSGCGTRCPSPSGASPWATAPAPDDALEYDGWGHRVYLGDCVTDDQGLHVARRWAVSTAFCFLQRLATRVDGIGGHEAGLRLREFGGRTSVRRTTRHSGFEQRDPVRQSSSDVQRRQHNMERNE
jgi:hypothetical protein